MSPAPVEIYVPQNVQIGDELVAEEPLRISENADELIAVSLSPSSDAVSIAPGVVKPGAVFRLILKDRDSLLKEFTIQCLGVYSGNLQEVPLRFILDNDDGNGTLQFERDSYDLKLSSPLLEKEIALIKMSSVVPSWASFTLTGSLSSHFSAYSEGGVVVVASIPCTDCVLDIPKQFSLLLTHSGSESHSTVLNFNVENNHRLRFEFSYEAEIEEGAASFKRVTKLKATGGKATYSLDDASGIFSVHPRTGILTVQHPEFVYIDSVGESVTLNATATDGQQRVRTTVSIRIVPKTEVKGFGFEREEYRLTVPAGQQEADGKLTLRGDTSHANVTYRISEGTPDLFRVSDGQLFHTGSFPKEDERFLLQILAETAKPPVAAVTSVEVTVKGIGSHVIELKTSGSSSVVISADEAPGKVLHTIELEDGDEDNRIEYTVERVVARDFEGNEVDVPKGAIEIVPNGRKAEVKLKSEIGDNEWLSLVTVVEAKDAAHSLEKPVHSRIEALITRRAKIKKAELPLQIVETPNPIAIPSSLPEGSFVYELRTTPLLNATYSLTNESENFSLDEITGVISTNRVLPFTPFKEVLTVVVKSPSQSVSRNLTIDIMDSLEQVPRLVQTVLAVELPVTAEIGTVVANLSVLNNIPVSYAPLEGSDLFLVDAKGVVVTAAKLAEDVKTYILLARVQGAGGYSNATINVTVDLEAGKTLSFSEELFHFKVMQNILVNSYVGTVHLASKRNLPVKYSISAEEQQEQLLDIDDEGRITVREELDAAESPRKYRVAVSDGMRRAEAEVELTILPAFDCVPEFVREKNDVFYINENSSPGELVGQVAAKPLDAKCDLSYFFWLGERMVEETAFARIDAKTGQIWSTQTFDFEHEPSYALVLGLKAGMRQTAAHGVVLLVRDQDDHPIRFQQSSISVEVSEASPLGSLVTTATAVDPDPSQRVYYLIRQEGDEFQLDRQTGEVRLAKLLDRETEDRYAFEVGATNLHNATEEEVAVWMTVGVVVRDVNDNGPVFDHGHYEALLEKTATPGRSVTTVHAVDPDLSDTGNAQTVFYSLADTQFEYRGTSRPTRGFFFVEQKTGEIVLLEPVNEFVGGLFHLQVQAADGLQPSARRSLTSLRVFIHDESDVVLSEILKGPQLVDSPDIQNVTQSIANATGLRVLVKDIRYHEVEGVVLNKITDLRMVLVNRTTYEIASADKTMAIMKSSGRKKAKDMPTIAKAQLPVFVQENSNFPPPIFLVAFVFVLLFILASAILGILVCHYRARYRREKQHFEDQRIIRNSLETPHRRPSPPSPPRLPTKEEDEKMGYMSQERRMSVGPDEGRTKA